MKFDLFNMKIKKYTNKPKAYIAHYVVGFGKNKYLIALAINKLQKTKLKNAVSYEANIEEVYKDHFKFNKVLKYGHFLFVDYAIYEYFENCSTFSTENDFEYALNSAKEIYNKAPYFEINENNVDDFILSNIKIISANIEPNISIIKKHILYNYLKQNLLKLQVIKCCSQHGDYNLPNMFYGKNNEVYLFDLERTMPNMIASYDWAHLLRAKNGWWNENYNKALKEVPNFDVINILDNIVADICKERPVTKKYSIKSYIAKHLTNKSIKLIEKCARHLSPQCVNEGFDRNYIENYVSENKEFIKGDILEFNGNVLYSKLYANKNSKIYTASSFKEKDEYNSDFYFDLNDKNTLPDKKFDCIIATQVICYILEGKTALVNFKKMLKPNGVLILTNSGPIYQDNKGYGYMCFYTKDGLEKLCGSVFAKENVFNLKTYGNLRTAIQSLLGTKKDDKYKGDNQENLSVIIGICCKNL